jgi:hypothetical protein
VRLNVFSLEELLNSTSLEQLNIQCVALLNDDLLFGSFTSGKNTFVPEDNEGLIAQMG